MTDMHTNDCERIDELLEAFLDGELEVTDAMAVERHVAGCRQCSESLALAGRIRDTLRATRRPSCPEQVAPAVQGRLDRLRSARTGWRPALAAALATLALGLALAWQQPWQAQRPSDAELAQARQDLRVALGYIAQAGQLAGRDVGSVVTGAGMSSIRDGLREGVGSRPLEIKDRDRAAGENSS